MATSWRQWVMRVMLLALALAAVSGGIAVLLGGEEVIVRVMFTSLITAGACLVMLSTFKLIDRQATRPSGLMVMAGIGAEFLMWLPMIWTLGTGMFSRSLEQAWLSTIVSVSWAWIPAVMLLRLVDKPAYRVAMRVGLTLCGLYLALALLGTWLPRSYSDHSKWWVSAWVVFVAMPIFLTQLIGIGQEPGRHWRWVGVVSSVVACAMYFWGIWMDVRGGSGWLACIVSLALVVAHANVVIRCPLKPGQQWLRAGTIVAAVVTAVVVDVSVVVGPHTDLAEALARLAGATGIVAACGSLALAILARLNRQVDHEPGIDGIVDMFIHCPRCQAKQRVTIGDASCSGCALRIHTRIEQPTCPTCGYLLYRLTSNACPECGTAVESAKSPPPSTAPTIT